MAELTSPKVALAIYLKLILSWLLGVPRGAIGVALWVLLPPFCGLSMRPKIRL